MQFRMQEPARVFAKTAAGLIEIGYACSINIFTREITLPQNMPEGFEVQVDQPAYKVKLSDGVTFTVPLTDKALRAFKRMMPQQDHETPARPRSMLAASIAASLGGSHYA